MCEKVCNECEEETQTSHMIFLISPSEIIIIIEKLTSACYFQIARETMPLI